MTIIELKDILLVYLPFSRKLRRAVLLYYYGARYAFRCARSTARALYSSVCHALFRSVCTLCLGVCKLIHVLRNRKIQIDSVLHVSIISNKQFMLSRLLRRHGIKSSFLALNTDISDRLAIGYDYCLPFHISPFKRRVLEFTLLWAVLSRYDVIHFHFNVLLSLDNGWEMEYLRKMKKILVFHFRGCDLRQKKRQLEQESALELLLGM